MLIMQAKLRKWVKDGHDRWFCDLCDLVSEPAFLVVHGTGCTASGTLSAGSTEEPISIAFGHRLLTEPRGGLRTRRLEPLPCANA